MDATLVTAYRQTPLQRKNFIQSNRHALLPLLGEEVLAIALEASASGGDMPSHVLPAIMRCKAGSLIWAEEAVKLRYTDFVDACQKDIRNLEDNNWVSEDIAAFRCTMMNAARSLLSNGVKAFEKKESEFCLFNLCVRVQVTSVHDDWEWRLLGRAKTLAVSQGLLERLPWEVLMFGESDPIPDVPQFMNKPPMELLSANANARDATKKLFSNMSANPTFATMRKEVAKLESELLAIDRSFVQEISPSLRSSLWTGPCKPSPPPRKMPGCRMCWPRSMKSS